jgi:N-acylneuraminate cytidylyltransferase
MDFDGVLTDDRVWVDEDGRDSVACSRADGMGIELLRAAGLPMTVISKERNTVVAARCRKLGIDHAHGIADKLPLLREWLAEKGVEASDTIYIGNDINDLACMQHVGCAVAPADARPAARQAADIVLDSVGGHGAVRELADMILHSGRLASRP